jgi:hypothetical protein
MSCCARFAPFHDDPARFFTGEAIDLDRLSLSPDGERRVTVTARGLFLTRDIAVQHDPEPIYAAGVHALPRWDHDTYLGGLGLDVRSLRGGRVLDVASGLALFATELSCLGAHVDCIDLELDAEHPSFAVAAAHVRARYAEQLAFLTCLARHSGNARYRMDTITIALLDELAAEDVAARYPAISGKRRRADARDFVVDDEYDLVACGWLFVHLAPEDERRVIERLALATRAGGRLHLRAGYGSELGPRLAQWFPGLEIASRRFALVNAAGDLAVLLRRADGA